MKPSEDFVQGWLHAFMTAFATGSLGAYPAKLAGVDVVIVGRLVPGDGPGLTDSVPLAVIITDELAEMLDLTEVRS